MFRMTLAGLLLQLSSGKGGVLESIVKGEGEKGIGGVGMIEYFCEIVVKKVENGKWDYRIVSKYKNGKLREISVNPRYKQLIESCKGRKYRLVYDKEKKKLLHADVEETKKGEKRKIIENGVPVEPLQQIYNRIAEQKISDIEKVMVLDARLREFKLNLKRAKSIRFSQTGSKN